MVSGGLGSCGDPAVSLENAQTTTHNCALRLLGENRRRAAEKFGELLSNSMLPASRRNVQRSSSGNV